MIRAAMRQVRLLKRAVVDIASSYRMGPDPNGARAARSGRDHPLGTVVKITPRCLPKTPPPPPPK